MDSEANSVTMEQIINVQVLTCGFCIVLSSQIKPFGLFQESQTDETLVVEKKKKKKTKKGKLEATTKTVHLTHCTHPNNQICYNFISFQRIDGKKIHVRSVDTTQVQQKFNKVLYNPLIWNSSLAFCHY